MSPLPIGTPVICCRERPTDVAWRRWDARRGVVVAVHDGEYGVDLTGDGRVTAWFAVAELAVDDPPQPAHACLTADDEASVPPPSAEPSRAIERPRRTLGGAARRSPVAEQSRPTWLVDPDTCEHVWEPRGVCGPYPVAACERCRSVSLFDAPGQPPAIEALVAGLAAAGCEPRPAAGGQQ